MKFLILTSALTLLSNMAFAQQTCPQDFKQIPIMSGANSCHIFDKELPASLSYFINSPPQQVLDFYLQNLQQPEVKPQPGKRFIVLFQQHKQRLIISPDAYGTQVDILIQP